MRTYAGALDAGQERTPLDRAYDPAVAPTREGREFMRRPDCRGVAGGYERTVAPDEPEAGPRLCDLLRDRRDDILAEWEAAVRQSESASASLPRDDLRDDIPRFVERLIAALDRAEADGKAVDSETTGRHASHRLRLGVELRHLIHEYRLLRQRDAQRDRRRLRAHARLSRRPGRLDDSSTWR